MKTRNSFLKVSLIIATVTMMVLVTTQFAIGQDWYNTNWQYRRPISVSNTSGNNLTDYQVLISLNSSFDFNNAKSDGSDIRVTSGDGIITIPFWIESWSASSQQAKIWVKVPGIPTSGTTVYIYYGNSNPPQPALVEGPPDGPFTKIDAPIIPIGDPQSGQYLLPENMVYDDETGHWWLIFNIYRGSPSSIGLVWSDNPTDPNSWHWYEGNPIITAGDAPHIMKYGDTWYVFYGDLREWSNYPSIRWSVAVSRSTDGITGPYDGSIHEYGHTGRDIVLPHGGDGSWDWYRDDEPYVFQRSDGKWIMVFMGDKDGYWPGLGGVQEQVGYAIADDIMGPYTKFSGNPIIPFGPLGSFDEGVVADPWVYEFNGTYYIGYAGVANTGGIGSCTAYVTTTDWQTFTKKPIIVTSGPPGSYDYLASARGAVTRVANNYVIIYFARPADWNYRMKIATQPVIAAELINDPKEVFDLYDGFDGPSLDVQNWFTNIVTSGSASVSNGKLILTGISSSSSFGYIQLRSSFPVNNGTIMECYAAHPTNMPPYNQVNNAQVGNLTYDFQWTNHLRLKDGPNSLYYEIRGGKDGNDSQNLPTTIPFSTYPPENYRTYTVYRPSMGVAKFRIDNSPFTTLAPQYVPVLGNIYPYMMAYTDQNKPQSRFEIDWIRIRKMVEPEPTTTLGNLQYPPILITNTKTDVSCNGGSNGAVDITVTGGSGSYSYLWSPGGQTTQDISVLFAGNYSVLVTDGVGNTGTSGNITITQPAALSLNAVINNQIVCIDGTATVVISATGGTAPYSGTGSFQQSVGTVVYSVIDANGCAANTSVTTVAPSAWYDPDWQYRRPVTITNPDGTILTDYQVLISLNSSFDFIKVKSDGSDIRITGTDGITMIPFWIETWNPPTSASIWTKVLNIPPGATTLYLYYGNITATSASNGSTTFRFFDDFESWGPGMTGWQDKAPMPTAIADLTTAAYNGKLYSFGGYGNGPGNPLNKNYEYDPATNIWTEKTPMPTARWGMAAVEFDGLIYVFGGSISSGAGNIAKNEVYNPLSNSWTSKTDIPSVLARQGLMGVKFGNKIHLFYESYHYEYDPATDAYTQKVNVPIPRMWCTSAVVGSKIYLIGGHHAGSAYNENQEYDPATDNWAIKAPLPISLWGTTRDNPVINGKIYVTHGLDGSAFHTDNYVYDPATNTWEQKGPAAHPRDGVGCGVVNNKLYVIGGRADFSGPYGLVYNEVYDPMLDNWTPQPGPSLWATSGTSYVFADASAKYQGNYGLVVRQETDVATQRYAQSIEGFGSAYALDFDWQITDVGGIGTQPKPQGLITLTETDPSGSLFFYNSGGIPVVRWFNGSGFNHMQNSTWNNWHKVTVVRNGFDSRVIFDEIQYQSPQITSPPLTGTGKIKFGVYWATTQYLDNVRVRKWAGLNPSTSLGGEQYQITLNGYFSYYNTANTPMGNVTVALQASSLPSVTSSTVPAGPLNKIGYFKFDNVCPGIYNVVATTGSSVGGINVTDAAQTNYWGVFHGEIEKVRFLAGDVTGNNNIASADASNILQYFLTQGNPTPAFASQWSFWKTGDELIPNNPPGPVGYPTITVAGSNVTQNLYGLVTGDFNQSFVPGGMKAGSETLALIYGETITVIPDVEFDLPLSVAMDMEVGAVSLIMEFPSDLLEVNGVYLSDDPNTPLMLSVSGDELRIGWNSLEPLILLEEENLLTLKVKLIGLPGEEGIHFKLAADPLNELADGSYNVIDNAVLSIDVITTSMTGTGEISLSDRLTLANHPNPFTGKTTFTYFLPVDGKVTLEIYDIVGNKVRSLVDVTQSAGDYVLSLDKSTLQPGVYTATIKLDSNGNLMTRTIKIISKY